MQKLYEGHLTEGKLEGALNLAFPAGGWIRNKQIPNSGRRFRPDFRNEHYKIVVEYDGDRHYTTARGAFNDWDKDTLYKSLGYKVLRIPYFIQVDQSVYSKLFVPLGALNQEFIFTDFPQGFVSDRCVLLADFCNSGLERFNYEMETTFRLQWVEVLKSLGKQHKDKKIWALVFPGILAGTPLWEESDCPDDSEASEVYMEDLCRRGFFETK